MSKNLVIDARMVGETGHGISQYVTDLALGMEGFWQKFSPLYLLNDHCPENHPLRRLNHHISKVPYLSKLEPWRLNRELARLNADAYLSVSFSSLWSYPCEHYLICHDLNHLKFGNFFQRQYYKRLLLPALNSAKAVATVSESAKKELEEWLGQSRNFSIIPNVIEPMASSESLLLSKLHMREDSFFFCLSNAKPHKNVEWLQKIHEKAKTGGETLPMLSNVGFSGGSDWIRLHHLPAREIGSLYKNAKAFFFPSLYEGFGRPPLEAAVSGTIPVVSDIPVFREALKGVKEAIFLSLEKDNDWIRTIQELSKAPKIRVSEESRQWILNTYSKSNQRQALQKFLL